MRVQHGVFGGVPTTKWRRFLSKLAHTPNLRVSFGQVALGGLDGVGGFGVGVGGVGDGVGGFGVGVVGVGVGGFGVGVGGFGVGVVGVGGFGDGVAGVGVGGGGQPFGV